MHPDTRVTPLAGSADQLGPQTVDQRFGREELVIDLRRMTTGVMRRNGDAVRRIVYESVGHAGMILRRVAQYSSHYPEQTMTSVETLDGTSYLSSQIRLMSVCQIVPGWVNSSASLSSTRWQTVSKSDA